MVHMLEQKYGDRGTSDDPTNTSLVGCVNSDKSAMLAAEFDLLFGLTVPDTTATATAAATVPSSSTVASGNEDDDDDEVIPDTAASSETSRVI